MATEHIYTVSSRDEDSTHDPNFCVIGSYRTLGRAVDECLNYIFERIEVREDIRIAFANDTSHRAFKFFRTRKDKRGNWHISFRDKKGLREFIREELEVYKCYYAGNHFDKYRFDIDENDLED